MPATLKTAIKILSPILMLGMIGLESWHLYTVFSSLAFPTVLLPVLQWGRLPVIAHLVEAVIAIAVAVRRDKAPIAAGVYTFLVGTVGLLEILESQPEGDRAAS